MTKLLAMLKKAESFLFKLRLRLWGLLGWHYWCYYPESNRMILTPGLCKALGVAITGRVLITTFEDFSRVMLNDDCRNGTRRIMEQASEDCSSFAFEFLAKHQQTEEVIFIAVRGRWVYNGRGRPVSMEGRARKVEPVDFQERRDLVRFRRIIDSYRNEGRIPQELLNWRGSS